MKKSKPTCKDNISSGKNDRNEKSEYWPTSIKESLNWLHFFNIMEFTEDKIKNNENFYPHC